MKREILTFDGSLPLSLSELNPPDLRISCQEDLNLFLVLWGSATFTVSRSVSHLQPEDIIVVNPNAVYEIDGKDCCMLNLRVGVTALSKFSAVFDCDSSKREDKSNFYALKHLFALFLKTNSSGTENNYYFNSALAYSVLSELSMNFATEAGHDLSNQTQSLSVMKSIIDYINENFRASIKLEDLAKKFNYSVPHFSKLFKRSFGVGFSDYYNNYRLDRAVTELTTSNANIDDIAHNNGFLDVRSFVSLFKNKYSTLPSAYRKTVRISPAFSYGSDTDIYKSELYQLSKYLTPPEKKLLIDRPTEAKKSIDIGDISVLSTNKRLHHTFKVFTSVGRAKELLLADVQEMIATIQKEVGYDYIKFHGILSDDMMLYDDKMSTGSYYSFVMIDKAIDFLLSVGLKPLIQLSFMPISLASDTSNFLFHSPFNVSPPISISKWNELITAVVSHLADRYGINEVRSWLFCVWNEPNFSAWNSFGDVKFFEFYKATRDTVKAFDSELVFGMPSFVYEPDGNWIISFFEKCTEHDCFPDFCNMHYYDNDFTRAEVEKLFADTRGGSMVEMWMRSPMKQNINESAFKNAIAVTKDILFRCGAGQLPLYLTEWNMTVSHRNLLNDTCFKSCYLMKSILENYDDLDSFGHWTMTDFIEETQPSNEHFHGGLGLFTHSGIKKASYFTFVFLNKLCNELISRGSGYFITRSESNIQIILYNYEHFSHLYASGETYDMSFTKRYTPFHNQAKLSISLTLKDLNCRKIDVRESILNWKHGSAFDIWVKMGAPKLTPEDVSYLKAVSVPKIIGRSEVPEDGKLRLNATLEPLEVRLIELNCSN